MARKKIVKPTLAEARKIKDRLQRQYPQMFKTKVGTRERKVISRASPADQKTLERQVGKKLKKIYRGK